MQIKRTDWMVVLLLAFITIKLFAEDQGKVTMDQTQLENVLRNYADSHTGGNGMLQFSYDGVDLLCISDVRANRMRIVVPIYDYNAVTAEQKDLMMLANFHTALDARYAVSNGILYAVFLHELSSLSEMQIRSGVRQTATLAKTFGTSFNSGALTFGGNNEEQEHASGETAL